MPPTTTKSALLVRCTGPDPKSLKTKHRSFFTIEAGKTSLSCSGFVASTNLVVTSAWLIAPFVSESQPGNLIYGTKIDCCGEDGVWRRSELIEIWRANEKVSKAVRELTGNDEELNIRGVFQYDLAVLACDTAGLQPVVDELQQNDFFEARTADRGAVLHIVSSAFGLVSPTVFRNSVTRGVLCNLVQSGSSSTSPPLLCLTDARCLAGSEGAPVFDSQNRFLGTVLPGLIRRDGSSLELGVVLPFNVFWDECITRHSSSGSPIKSVRPSFVSTKRDNAAIPSQAARSVALIRVGANWGSGVLIHKNEATGEGIVLTCAHVVKPHLETAEMVSVSFRGGMQAIDRMGTVKYSCEGPVDIAFISVPRLPNWLDPAALVTEESSLADGDEVSAVGHAIFEPNSLLGRNSTISTGTLSKVVSLEGKPALLQTCAQVYRGHSGGMICDDRGRLLGIITSNAKHSDGSIIPEINFAVPLCFVKELLAAAKTTTLVEEAKKFDDQSKTNQQLKMLWALQPVETGDAPSLGGGRFYNFFARFLDSQLAKL